MVRILSPFWLRFWCPSFRIPGSETINRLAGRLWGPRGRPRAPSWGRAPSPENRHQKIVIRKSTSRGTVWGSFWPKLVKSRAFKPNGRHEQFRSALFIGKSSVGCSKALTRTPFVTNREVDFPALSGRLMWISLGRISGPGDGPRHGMRPLSSQNLIRPYPPPIVVARGLIRPYPFFFVLFFFQ